MISKEKSHFNTAPFYLLSTVTMSERKSINLPRLLLGGLVLIAIFFVMYYVIKIALYVAAFMTPFLLIATFLMRKQVIFKYLGHLKNLFKKNPAFAVVACILSIVLLPLVAVVLFIQALLFNKIDEIGSQMDPDFMNRNAREQEGYIAYEEIDSQLLNNTKQQKQSEKIEQNIWDTFLKE